MNNEKLAGIRSSVTTEETGFTSPQMEKTASACLGRISQWCTQRIDNHFDRLIELRVYDDRRYDYSAGK